MIQYNDNPRNYLPSADRGTPLAVRPEMPPSYPCPPSGRSYGAGFTDGFCDGVGKFLGLVPRVLPIITGFRKGV